MDYFKSCDKEMSYDNKCSYCGSISTAKAVDLLSAEGTRFSGSDWKYGYPHKFYIDDKSGEHFKFYTEHLLYTPEDIFNKFNILSKKCFDIEWAIVENKRLRYYCIPGIQLWGIVKENGTPVHGII